MKERNRYTVAKNVGTVGSWILILSYVLTLQTWILIALGAWMMVYSIALPYLLGKIDPEMLPDYEIYRFIPKE